MCASYGGDSGSDETQVTVHDLRHTAASLAIQSGANVKVLQRVMGHSSASLTLDVYADMYESDLDEVSKKMSELATKAPKFQWATEVQSEATQTDEVTPNLVDDMGYTVFVQTSRGESRLGDFPDVGRARSAANTLLDGGLTARCVIRRESGLDGVPDYHEELKSA